MAGKIEVEIESLLKWAFVEELSKRQLSSAEGIWERIQEDGQRGGVDKGHGAAQRYSHFGLPDPDAELIEKAVGALEDTVIDWEQSFDAIAAELAALISVNEVKRDRHQQVKRPKAGWGKAGTKALEGWWGRGAAKPIQDRPRDVLMVAGLRTNALVTMHAIKETRPDWHDDPPEPKMVMALKGPNAQIVGECRGRNLYTLGAYCPLRYEPSPMSIISSRAEYLAWHHGLTHLANTLVLSKFTPLPPRASPTPWLDPPAEESRVVPVIPTGRNSVAEWGKLPLAPARGRMGGPMRAAKAGPVRFPLAMEGA